MRIWCSLLPDDSGSFVRAVLCAIALRQRRPAPLLAMAVLDRLGMLRPGDDLTRSSDDRAVIGHQHRDVLLASELDNPLPPTTPAERNILESAYDLHLIAYASVIKSFRGDTAGMLDDRRTRAMLLCRAGVEHHGPEDNRSGPLCRPSSHEISTAASDDRRSGAQARTRPA